MNDRTFGQEFLQSADAPRYGGISLFYYDWKHDQLLIWIYGQGYVPYNP